VALSGGIGGAKLSLGLARLLGSDPSHPRFPQDHDRADEGSDPNLPGEGSDPRLTIIVNTGDDFEHLGLAISPDIDTALYTLAASSIPRPAGAGDETWTFMEALARPGGPPGSSSATATLPCMSIARSG
jgi:LPPG:FO 2-phospho-L-lactate transferase